MVRHGKVQDKVEAVQPPWFGITVPWKLLAPSIRLRNHPKGKRRTKEMSNANVVIAVLFVCIAILAPDIDEGSVQHPTVEQLCTADIKAEIANGGAVLAWLKQDNKLTDLLKDEGLTKFKGALAAFER